LVCEWPFLAQSSRPLSSMNERWKRPDAALFNEEMGEER
jgi:hypothetical protein